jgi:DNA sulfur modification protein DndD
MIIEKISLINFRAYKEASIELSKTKNKNVTLIYGENGAGKTSFFYGINWCFYGRKFNNIEIIPKNVRIDGKYLKQELEDGQSTDVEVRITFTHKNVRYTLSRRLPITKKNGSLIYGDEIVELDSYNPSGESTEYDIDLINRKINSFIPVTTREYFFFDGEKIDRFSDVGNSREIESSIRAVLGLDYIKNTGKYLHQASKHYDKLVSSDGDNDFTRLVKIIDQQEKEIEDLDSKLLSFDTQKSTLHSNLSEIKKKSEIFQQEKKAREDFEKIKSDITLKEQAKKKRYIEIHDELRRSYCSFSLTIHKKAHKLMKKWSDNGVFPSEVFNEELIDKTLDKCTCIICGNKFSKGDNSYKHVESLKGDVLFSRDIEKELNEFNMNVKDSITKGNLNYKLAADIYGDIQQLIKEIDDLVSKRDALKEKITKNITDDELKEIFELQHALETQTIPALNIEIRNTDDKRKNKYEQLIKLRKQKEKLKLQSKSEQENKEKSDMCVNSHEAVEYILHTYADEKRKQIDELCRTLFQALVWKESHFKKVELTDDYSLKVYDIFGEPARPDLSAGERQVLSLSFITAMAKSAGKEAPFIIDTPFGRISKKPRKFIAEQIPDKVSQLVLFVTDTELTEESEKIFASKSSKVWSIHFDQKLSISTIEAGKNVD